MERKGLKRPGVFKLTTGAAGSLAKFAGGYLTGASFSTKRNAKMVDNGNRFERKWELVNRRNRNYDTIARHAALKRTKGRASKI